MEITLIGIIVIILSVILFFKNEDWLLYLVIFTSPFVAAMALNIKKTTTAIVPFEIPLVLWNLRQFVNIIACRKKINIEVIKKIFKENKIFTAIFLFTVIMIISEIWLLISGIKYPYYDILYHQNTFIKFGISNITQPARIIFFLIFSMLLSIKKISKEQIRKMIKIFAISGIFAVMWGYLQFILYYLGIDYPTIFNNNPYYYQGYDQIEFGIKRITSIGTEPSVFSLNLLAFIPIFLVEWCFIEKKENIMYKVIVNVTLIFSIACLILTTSSTSYFGFAGIIIILFIYLMINKVNMRKQIILKLIFNLIIMLVIAILCCMIGKYIENKKKYSTYEITQINAIGENKDIQNSTKEENSVSEYENFFEMIKTMTISKLSTGSGQERVAREKLGIELFKKSPIFGVGFGSFRTFSMLTNIMVNTGILGLVAFIYFNVVVFCKIIKNFKEDTRYALIFLLSIIGMSIALVISVPDLIYIYYWIMLVISYKYFEEEKVDK